MAMLFDDYAPPETAKKIFLENYLRLHRVYNTCNEIGLDRRTFYHWLRHDEESKKNFQEARTMIVHALEDEAFKRAVEGVQKPVYQGGELVGYITEYSDSLLLKLLQANAPEKYREGAAANININNAGGTMQIAHIHSDVPLLNEEMHVIREISNSPTPKQTPAEDHDLDELLS